MTPSFFSTYKDITQVDEVIAFMESLNRELEASDMKNLRAFNTTYLIITRAVNKKVNDGYFMYPDVMKKVDVIFAHYYFDALAQFVHQQHCPDAWKLLFEQSRENNYHQYIFMALGVNAHVNNDLPQSLKDANVGEEFFDDYEKVNGIIKSSLKEVVNSLQEQNIAIRTLSQRMRETYAFFLQSLIQNWRMKAWEDYRALTNNQKKKEDIEESATTLAQELCTMKGVFGLMRLPKLMR